MSDDIVERLRYPADATDDHLFAAAEIERLRAALAEVIAERDSIRTMLLSERNEWMDEAIRRQASVNANLAELVTDAQEELRKCQQDAIRLQAQLAAAERERDGLQNTLIDTRHFIVMACGEHGPAVKIALSKIDTALKGRQP